MPVCLSTAGEYELQTESCPAVQVILKASLSS